MNNLRKNFMKKFLIALLAAVCCASLFTGVLLNRRGGLAPDGVNKVFAEEVAAPLRAYTAIRVEPHEGYQVIAGQTTARSLKNNVVVRGTTDPNQNFSASYILNNDEYVIQVGGKTLGAEDFVFSGTVGESTAAVSVTFVANDTAVRPVTFNVTDMPSFSGEITLNVPDQITDDHTDETILKVISVIAGETVIPNDLYKVTLTYNGSKATIKVTDAVGFTAPEEIKVVDVIPAVLRGVDLQVKSEYKLNGAYYQDKDGYDAFIQGDNQESVLSKLDLIAIYDNSRKCVELTFNNGYLTTPNITNSNLSVSWSAPSGNFEISFDYNGINAKLSLYFAEQSVHHIEVDKDLFQQILKNVLNSYGYNLDSSLELNISDFVDSVEGNPFTIVTNSNNKRPASSQEIAFDGNFAPTAKDIIAGTGYSKEIKIVYKVNGEIITSAIPAVVEIADITLIAPDSVLLSGDIASQMIHHDFDYSGLEVTFIYSSGSEIKILLTDFFANLTDKTEIDKFLTVNIFSDLAGTKKEDKITKNTKRVNAKFTYDSVESNIKNKNNVSLLQDAIKVPALDCSLENYKLGLTREFNAEELKYNKYNEAGELIGEYNMTVAIYSDKDCNMSMDEAYAKLEGNEIKFFAGGEFYIKVSLENEKLDEYDFEVINNNSITRTDHDLVYYIKINKGMLSVGLDDFDDDIKYGDSFTPVVNGTTLGGIEYTLVNTEDEEVGEGKLAVPYKIVYVASDETFDPDMFKTDGKFDENKFNGYSEKTNLSAGTYKVYVFTKETGAYLSAQSDSPKTLVIGKKTITLDDNATNEFIYTRGADYKAKDFVSAGSGSFAYDDTAEKVLGSKIYVGTTATVAAAPYYVGDYKVTISVNADYQKNYSLSAADDECYSADVSFTVTAREISFTVNASGWTYGDVNPNPNASVTKCNDFYAALEDTDVVYYKGSVAEANKIDLSTDPFNTWAVGTYIAYYQAKDPENAQYPDELKSGAECYNLPDGSKEFTVAKKGLERYYVEGWGLSETSEKDLGYYGQEYIAKFKKWIDPAVDAASNWNTVTDGAGDLIYTVKMVYIDIAGTETVTAVTGNTLALTKAGSYVISIKLNPNYSWSNTTDTLTFYAKIKQQIVYSFKLSDNAVYNGRQQTVNAVFRIGDENFAWHKDNLKENAPILSFDGDITGSGKAAEGLTVTGNNSDGTFKVAFAGDYAVKVKINDTNNYKWHSESEKSELTYTVSQAPFKISSSDKNIPFDEAATDGQRLPVFSVDRTLEASGADDAVLTVVKYAITTKAGATVTDNKITAAGDYILTVIEIGGTAYKNYSLTDANAAISFEFTVESAGLDRFTGLSSNSEEFNGDNYIISSYIADFETKYKGRLVITVEGFTDNNPGLRNADTYYITIKPAPNYKWKGDDQSDITLTFAITALEVDFTWGDCDFTYNGNGHVPTVTFKNNKDGAGAELTVKVTSVNATDGKAINAGNYTAAFELSGDLKGNYSLPGDCTKSFTVKKQILTAPARVNNDNFSFSKEEQSVTYNWIVNGNTMNGVSLNGRVTISDNGSTNFFGYANTFTPDNNTGVVTFKNAGTYKLSFDLTADAFKNFSWDGGAQSATAEFTVNRKQVTAPALGAQRAIEWDGNPDSKLVPNNLNGTAVVDGAWTVSYDVKYGVYNNGFVGDIKTEQVTTAQGSVYFVVLTITEDDSFNYVWVENNDDTDGRSFLTQNAGQDAYGEAQYDSANGVRMFLGYTITLRKLLFEVSVNNYTFGDNGVRDEYTTVGFNNFNYTDGKLYVDCGGVLNFAAVTGSESHLSTLQDLNPEVNISFAHKNNVSFNLVNGLPWEAGDYTATVKILFDKDNGAQKDYNDLIFEDIEFTVSARVVNIAWSGAETVVYNGAEQKRVATVTNVPKKNADDTAESFTLTVNGKKNVVLLNNTPVAQEITATEETLSSDFTLTGAQNVKSQLTITPKTLKVYGTSVTEHIYGDDITDGEKIATADNGEFGFCPGDRLEDYINVLIVDENGNQITKEAAVGDYFVKPVLKTGKVNYIIDESAADYKGTFTVVKRDITVTFSGATSVYGAAPADVANFLYGKVAIGGKGLPSFAAKQSVLSVSASITNTTDAGDYDISCTLKTDVADNYNLIYTTAIYEVTQAVLTVNVNINGVYYGEADPATKEYKFVDITDSIYKITGFKNGQSIADIKEGITGTPSYRLADGIIYAPYTNGVGTYSLLFDGNMSHINYTFKAGTDSWFKVIPLPINVSHEDQTAVFYTEPDALTDPAVTTKATSIYGEDIAIEAWENIISLSTNAYTEIGGKRNTATVRYDTDKNVIGYDITFALIKSGSYTVSENKVIGKYTITPADLQNVILDGYTGYSFNYDANPHSIINIDGVTKISDLAKTVDDTPITVKFNDTVYTEIPVVTTKGTYTYTFTISAANHKDETGTITVTVNFGANGIKEGYKLFDDAAADKDGMPEAFAWTYGDYDNDHTSGYNADGNQRVITPTGIFDDSQFTYTLTHGDYIVTDSDLNNLFAAAWANGKLTAGDYSVKIVIAATDNYSEYIETWHFKVAKQKLTITPDDFVVTYGSEFNDYTSNDPVGLVKNGGILDVINDVVTFTFGSDYVAGYENGSVKAEGYTISVKTQNVLSDNYDVEFGTAKLRVDAQEITIEIENKDNYFNLVLREGNEYKLDTIKPYTFKLISGTFADGDGENINGGNDTQSVFVLTSKAFIPFEEHKTNKAGKYPIYITAGTRFAKDGNNNYVIKVIGTYDGVEVADNIAYDKAKAGVFEIKAAVLSVSVSENPFTAQVGGKETDLIYDGTAKYYHEFIRILPEGVNPTFEYEYLDSENKNISAPSAVGSYTVIIKAKDTNYSIADAEKPFTIRKRTISVTENFENSKGAYNTVSANTYTFNGGNFIKTLTFGNYLESEKVSFITSVGVTGSAYSLGDYTPSQTVAVNDINYVFNARNTGTYSVNVTLAALNGFNPDNYQFNEQGAASVSFSFTVQKAVLNVTVADTTVQYGAPLTDTLRFNGVEYTFAVAANTESDELIKEEQGKGAKYWQRQNNGAGVQYLTDYNPSKSVWGTKYQIYFDNNCLTAPNFEINPVKTYNLSIIAREIEITVKGYTDDNKLASCTYAGQSHNHNTCLENTFRISANKTKFLEVAFGDNFNKPTADNYDPINGVVLRISDAKNVQILNMAAAYEGQSKYSVKFINTAGIEIKNDINDNNCPKYAILQKDLFITVSGKDVSGFDNETSVNFEMAYGTVVALNNNLNVYYSGWAEGETQGVIPNNGSISGFTYVGGGYTPWQGLAGQRFNLRLTHDLEYLNYKVNIVDSAMTIGSLVLEAEVENLTYLPDANDYHGGAYGKTQSVKLNFKTTDGRPFIPGEGDFASAAAFDYDASYGGKTPNKVDNYTATVTFKTNAAGGYNYKFKEGAGSTTQKSFDFRIEKFGISLSWSGGASLRFEEVTDGTSKTVVNYNAQIMDFVSFINGTSAVPADYYVIDSSNTENGFEFMSIKAAGIGRYVLTVSLNSAAKENYKWTDGDEVTTVIILTVAYDSSFVIIENFTVADWVYNDVASIPSAELNPPVEGGTFVYKYAVAPDDIDTTKRVPVGVDGLAYTMTVPKDAGWYVAMAEYVHSDYTANPAYYLFQIKKAKIDAPAFNPSGITYTGSNINAKLTYNTQSVYVRSFGGTFVTNADGATLSVVNKGDYVVTIALRDTFNYEWNEDSFNGNYSYVGGDNTAVTLTWSVVAATDNAIIWDTNDIVTEYGDSYGVIDASATYSSARVYFAAKLENETNAPAVDDGRWDIRRPSQYSEYGYWVMAYCPATDNYNVAVQTKTLTINKATLTFNPTVAVVYGVTVGDIQKTLSLDGYKNSFSGFKGGDTGATVNGTFSFTFINDRNDTDVLDANTYNVRITVDGSGFVAGIISNNYNVKPATEENTATLIVFRRSITVIIGDSESIYDQVIVNNNTLSVVGELDFDTDILGVTLTCTAHKGDNVGGNYTVEARGYTNNNYDVTFVSGRHTVKPLLVKVEIETEDGIFGFKNPSAFVSKITTTNLAANTDLDVNLPFVIRYTGVAFDGTVLTNPNDIPAHAGNYIVTVLSTGSENYVLDSLLVYSANVSVKRREINADDIEIPSAEYTGEAIEPNVTVISGVYEVAEHAPFVNKGVYTVNLRLLDTDNYKWKSREEGVALREVDFRITAAANRFETEIEIKGWIYGKYSATDNKPSVEVLHGVDTVVFEYSDSRDGIYTVYVPANREVGTYWVRARVPASENYNEKVSEPVSFKISKAPLAAPTLATASLVFDKEAELSTEILGYNMTLMFAFDHVTLSGGVIKLRADNNVGVYVTKVTLTDSHNYCWAEGTDMDGDGNALLTLTVTRKPIAKPTHNNRTLVVNGSILEYLPNGFDAEIMEITGNKAGYGGTFKAYVSLKDTENYMWEDGTDATLPPFTWKIVGSNTVFIAVMCSMSGVSAIAGATAAVLYVKYRKKQNEKPIDDGTTPEGGDTPPEGNENKKQGEVNA